jgi:hypothetical protein
MSAKGPRAEKAACPSARAEPGAILLGVVGEDGRVQYLKDRIEIDQDFIDLASQDGPLEQRFRFGGTCVESGCQQWDGGKCRVIETVASFLEPETTASLPPCSIRPTCRWYRQAGPSACRICPLVRTEIV